MLFYRDQFRYEYCEIYDDGKRGMTELQRSEEVAKKRAILSHYTSYEALKCILSQRNLKFNRIDNVNDRMESNVFGEHELSRLVFVSCFTNSEIESIPMWSIYGKDQNGLRLSLELEKSNFTENFLGKPFGALAHKPGHSGEFIKMIELYSDWIPTATMKDIVYDIDAIYRNPIRNGDADSLWFNLTAMAAIKRKEWEYEKESRLIITLSAIHDGVTAPLEDYILVPIKFDCIKKLVVTFNPWMSEELKKEIEEFVISKIPELNPEKIDFKNSVLTGEIKELH